MSKKYLTKLVQQHEAAAMAAGWSSTMPAAEGRAARKAMIAARAAVISLLRASEDVDSLRAAGYAVVVISPERLDGLAPKLVEQRLDEVIDNAVQMYREAQ